jgi:hypothetical protein
MVVRITFEAALVAWIFRFRPTFMSASHAGGGPGNLAEAAAPIALGAGLHHFHHRPGSRTGRLRRAIALLVHLLGCICSGAFLGAALFSDPAGGEPALLQGGPMHPQRPLTRPHSLSAGPLFQLCWLLVGHPAGHHPRPGLERHRDGFLRTIESPEIPRQCRDFQFHFDGPFVGRPDPVFHPSADPVVALHIVRPNFSTKRTGVRPAAFDDQHHGLPPVGCWGTGRPCMPLG